MATSLFTTDEWIDRFVCRPLARPLVWLFAKTPMSPNHVTFLAGTAGVIAGVSIAWGAFVCGALFIFLFMVLDCGDGQLARLRGGGSPLGRVMDGFGDYAAALSIHVGLMIYYWRAGEPWWWALLLPLAAALCMAWKAMLFDRYKRRFAGSEDDLDDVRAARDASNGFAKWSLNQFLSYAEKLDADGVTVIDRARYVQRTRGPYALFFLNGPSMHYSLAAVSLLLKEPRVYLYAATVPMMAMEFVALVWQRHAEDVEPPVVSRA